MEYILFKQFIISCNSVCVYTVRSLYLGGIYIYGGGAGPSASWKVVGLMSNYPWARQRTLSCPKYIHHSVSVACNKKRFECWIRVEKHNLSTSSFTIYIWRKRMQISEM